MVRVFLILSLFTVYGFSEEVPWYEQGFVANADTDPRVAAMRNSIVAPVIRDWHACGAIRTAQVKHAELFAAARQPMPCHSNDDCGLGSLGGFCGGAYHKTQLQGYAIYTRSPAYTHLTNEWRTARCIMPVGLCFPVSRAYCDDTLKVCKGDHGRNPSVQPNFMALPESTTPVAPTTQPRRVIFPRLRR